MAAYMIFNNRQNAFRNLKMHNRTHMQVCVNKNVKTKTRCPNIRCPDTLAKQVRCLYGYRANVRNWAHIIRIKPPWCEVHASGHSPVV